MRFLIVVCLVAISILAVNAAPLEERNGEDGDLAGPGRNDEVDGDAAYEPLSRHRRSNRRRRPVSSSSSSSSSEEMRRHKGGRAQAQQHAQAARGRGTTKGRKLGGRQFYAAAPIAYTGYPGYPAYPAPAPVVAAPMYG